MLIERVRTEPDPYEPLLSQAIRAGDLLDPPARSARSRFANA
jgi:hypothetical protein